MTPQSKNDPSLFSGHRSGAVRTEHLIDRDAIRFEITGLQGMKIPLRLPMFAEFCRNGGISLDYDGAWDDETFTVHPESLPHLLLRLAFAVAYLENDCGNACGTFEPEGFVPEDGCPIHDR